MFLSHFSDAELAEIYREASIAVLDGALQERGAKAQLAQQLGYTRGVVVVSQNLGPNPRYRFGLEHAEKIPKLLGLDQGQAKLLTEYLKLAHEREVHLHKALREEIRTRPSSETLTTLRDAAAEAAATQDLQRARELQHLIYNHGRLVTRYVSPSEAPLDFADICLLIADVALKIGQPSEAFLYAKLAERALPDRQHGSGVIDPERRDVLELTSIHTQVNAYHHLKAYREAVNTAERGERKADLYRQHMWLPSFYRDHIAAITRIRGFQIGQAEDLAIAAKRIITVHGGSLGQWHELLVDRALASAYLTHTSVRFKQAQACLDAHQDFIESTPELGSLIPIMFYRTYAQVLWRRGKYKPSEDWTSYTKQALALAVGAGHVPQIKGMQRNFGSAIESILVDLGV